MIRLFNEGYYGLEELLAEFSLLSALLRVGSDGEVLEPQGVNEGMGLQFLAYYA
jgi:hypothetical protein